MDFKALPQYPSGSDEQGPQGDSRSCTGAIVVALVILFVVLFLSYLYFLATHPLWNFGGGMG